MTAATRCPGCRCRPRTPRALEQAVAAADDGAGPATEIRWHGGQFAPAQTAAEDPFVALVHAADERVAVDDLARVARAIALTILRFG